VRKQSTKILHKASIINVILLKLTKTTISISNLRLFFNYEILGKTEVALNEHGVIILRVS
jgi:hypothetical protein